MSIRYKNCAIVTALLKYMVGKKKYFISRTDEWIKSLIWWSKRVRKIFSQVLDRQDVREIGVYSSSRPGSGMRMMVACFRDPCRIGQVK